MDISRQNSKYAHLIGVGFVLLGFFCASCLSALGKTLLSQIPLGMVLFVQNAVAFFIYFLFSLTLKENPLKTDRWGLHLFRAIMGLASYVCLFLAVRYIPLVNATLLANSSPLFLPFIIWIWFHQKIRIGLWISLLIGFSGVICIVNPIGEISSLLNSWMVLVALLGSIFSAIALQSIRYLLTTEKITTVNLYYFGLSSLITLPWACLEWPSFAQIGWISSLGIGIFLTLIQFFLAAAYRYASPTILGPFNYSITIFSGILGWVFWRETPTILGGVGLLLISLGGILSMTKFAKGSL